MKNPIPALSQYRMILGALFFVLLGSGATRLEAQCNNDVTPPAPLCTSALQKQVQLYKPTIISSSEFNAGSTDNCSSPAALQFFVELGNNPSPAPPQITTLQYPASQTGQYDVVLWVVDSAGNAAHCTTTLNLVACTNSTQSLACNDQIVVALGVGGTAVITPGLMLEGGPYCSDYEYKVRFMPSGTYTPSMTVGQADVGTHTLQVSSFKNGNPFNSCWGTVIITGGCTPDVTPPTVVCNETTTIALDTSLSESVVLEAGSLDNGSYDNCTSTGNLVLEIGLNFPAGPFSDTLHFEALGLYNVFLRVTDEAGNQNVCITEVEVTHKPSHLIQGTVFRDENADCDRQSGSEAGLVGWQLRAVHQSNGQVYVGSTDSAGHYTLKVPLDGTTYDVMLAAPFNYGGGVCPTTYVATFTKPTKSETFDQDFPVLLDFECPQLYVDLATPKIRPCFPGVYFVNYSNLGGQTITDTHVDVTLDAALGFQSSSIPETDLGNQTYRFETGDLEPGESGWFTIVFFTSCSAQVGATHCTEAHIYPDTICSTNPQWSGADVTVQAQCVNDSIHFSIKNKGIGPNAGQLNYIVVEDVLMRTGNTFQLSPGQTMSLAPIPANGATFRLQADQEPGHPYGGVQAVAVEGCGGFTPGMVTVFPLNPSNPFVAVFCKESVSSLDPNDKQALPRGYGVQHFVEKNTDLDYTIRFQNTGSDTAFQVILLDTLSTFLAASRLRPGVSSHPYRFELLNGHIAKFVFENIALPDSNVNLARSEGFVQFRIPQTPNNSDGSRIENSAAIYFDFNPPVITNTTWHTVGTNFITSATTYTDPNRTPLRVYPNPAHSVVHFAADGIPGEHLNLSITDALGREVRHIAAAQLPIALDCSGLPSGMYFFQITGSNARIGWAGTLVVR